MSGITNPAEKYFKDGLWTFDGTVWRPQSQLLAYRDVVRQNISTSTTAVGTNNKDFDAVPAGEVWCVTSLIAYNETTAASAIVFGIVSGGVEYYIHRTTYDAITRYASRQGWWTMKATEFVRVYWTACALNDTRVAAVTGHRFRIAE